MAVHTPPTYTYDSMWTSIRRQHSHLSFAVITCSDARVLLSSVPGRSDVAAYEVEIGVHSGNTSAIRKLVNGQLVTVATRSTPGYLSCLQMNLFWLSWLGGTIKVGTGDPYGGEFLAWHDTEPYGIYSVQLSSGTSEEAEWEIDQEQSRYILLIN